MKQSKDSILLAEDQYPVILDAVFTRLTNPTSLQNTINVMQWDRRASVSYDAELKATTVDSQNYMRDTYQLTPTMETLGTIILLDSGNTSLPIYASQRCKKH